MLEMKRGSSIAQIFSKWILRYDNYLRVYTSDIASIEYWILRRLRYITGADIEIRDGYVDIYFPRLQPEGIYLALKALKYALEEGGKGDDIRPLYDLGDEGLLFRKRVIERRVYFLDLMNVYVSPYNVVWLSDYWYRPDSIARRFQFSSKYESILLFGIGDSGNRDDAYAIQFFREGRYLEDLPIYSSCNWTTSEPKEPPVICDLGIGFSMRFRGADFDRSQLLKEVINQVMNLPEGG